MSVRERRNRKGARGLTPDQLRAARPQIYDPKGPGIRCPACGAYPGQQHLENCPEADPGP
jgi:hypothetical protein